MTKHSMTMTKTKKPYRVMLTEHPYCVGSNIFYNDIRLPVSVLKIELSTSQEFLTIMIPMSEVEIIQVTHAESEDILDNKS
jgi:hypothetical protein